MKIYAKRPNDKKGDKLRVTMVRQPTGTRVLHQNSANSQQVQINVYYACAPTIRQTQKATETEKKERKMYNIVTGSGCTVLTATAGLSSLSQGRRTNLHQIWLMVSSPG